MKLTYLEEINTKLTSILSPNLAEIIIHCLNSTYSILQANGVQIRPRVGRNLGRGPPSRGNKAIVIVYDASALFFVQRNLAEKYM